MEMRVFDVALGTYNPLAKVESDILLLALGSAALCIVDRVPSEGCDKQARTKK